MSSFGFEEMQAIQKELQEKYFDKWGGLNPQKGRDSLLWMMIEAGEAADIIKKQGDKAILENPETRHDFIEEMCDVMMYFNDVLLCYSITPEELTEIYQAKHERNMKRWTT
ncbi:nucleotide pyrophosphohydrolase [Neglecta sp. X4]|uniref:nucleotide pyrophosphohydrolase n=1 Tax=unclassified Neglectibacter TaxID=2632164 RepID=UPI00136F33AC|nr:MULTISPECIES: nucleotide pyrophosphohydrolase [unclassified Neglectibacter]NBI16915.1 nucleotide pyrophosphohydrolase [Neglectibacter sp. 59]NBJ72328.1 nucleotide pyrophosphohydrolase [Neglectibacter sp. X4]NCE79921.1 nucleotide pyrophosphohydrolase [Neglectibacter sp. X58]